MDVGTRVRALRNERGFSLEALAEKSGVALGTLSKLENGKVGSTFRTVQKITEALGVTQAELYKGLESPEEVAVLVEPEAKEAETFTYDAKASAVLLTTKLSGKTMLPQLVILQPDGKTSVEEYRKGTQRLLFGWEGTAEIKLANKSYKLAKGGSLYLDASVPHQILNANRSVAKVLSVISPVAL